MVDRKQRLLVTVHETAQGLRDEDFIEFGTLGAYGLATATRFNGYGNHSIVTVDRVLEM